MQSQARHEPHLSHGPPAAHGHVHAHGDHGHDAEPDDRDHDQAGDHAHAGHDHHHGHSHGRTPAAKLRIALVLTGSFMIVEAAVGWLSGSLALVADAGHMLSDTAALGLALIAQRIAARPRSVTHTFGSRRAEVIAAFVNGVALVMTALLIVREALERLFAPSPIQSEWMLATAAVGLMVNLASAAVLGHGGHRNANTRAALMHVLADALGSVGAIVAALLVMVAGWTRADPAVSLFIAALIFWGSWRLVKETAGVLMEGTPSHINVNKLEKTIRRVPGVAHLHDLHVWTISEGFEAVSVHIVLDGDSHGTEVAQAVAEAVRQQHGIDHVTVQPEAPTPGLVQLRLSKGGREYATCKKESS